MTPRDPKRTFILIAWLLPLATARAEQVDMRQVPRVGIDQKLGARIPMDLTFVDESGAPIELRRLLEDKPGVLALVYYKCPMLCGQVLNGLLDSLKGLSFDVGDEFQVLAVSIDPSESPALAASKKLKYVAGYGRTGTNRGWHFLTGDAESIEALTDTVGFRYEYDPQTKQFAHAAGIMVFTPDGRVSRYLYGIDYPPRDLRLSLVEASEGAVGSAVDQLLLLCYHYDPTTGKYGLVIMNALRIAGSGTVLVIASFVTVMLLRERRSRCAKGQSRAMPRKSTEWERGDA